MKCAASVRNLAVLGCVASGALGSQHVHAQCVPGWEQVGYANSGTSGSVRASTYYDGGQGERLHVGGPFRDIEGTRTFAVASLDGQGLWQPLGGGAFEVVSGFGGAYRSPGEVRAMAVFDPDGAGGQRAMLVVGGRFEAVIQPDGEVLSTPNIAAWDGERWHAMGSRGLGWYSQNRHTYPAQVGVYDLVVYDTGSGPRLYAAGEFDNLDGVVDVARWDGSEWVSAGYNSPGVQPKWSAALRFEVHTDSTGPALYLANQLVGNIATVDIQPVSIVYKFDGAAWTALSNSIAAVYSLNSVPDPMSGVGARKLMVCGPRMQATWSGTGWVPIQRLPSGYQPTAAAAMHDDGTGEALYIGAVRYPVTTTGTNDAFTRVFKYSGGVWSAIGKEMPCYRSNSWGYGGYLDTFGVDYLGEFRVGSDRELVVSAVTDGHRLMRWDGQGYVNMNGTPRGNLFEVSDEAFWGNVLSIASFPLIEGDDQEHLIASGVRLTRSDWEGEQGVVARVGGEWVTLGGSMLTPASSVYRTQRVEGVQVLERSSGSKEMYAVVKGHPNTSSGIFEVVTNDRTNVFRYSGGTSWTLVGQPWVLGDGRHGNLLAADLGAGEKLYFLGGGRRLDVPDGPAMDRFFEWSGTAWESIDQGIAGTTVEGDRTQSGVSTSAVYNDGSGNAIFALIESYGIGSGGGWTFAVSYNRPYKWDGTAWIEVSNGFPTFPVFTRSPVLFVLRGSLYASVSNFSSFDSEIYAWDGHSWNIAVSGGPMDFNSFMVGIPKSGPDEVALFHRVQTTGSPHEPQSVYAFDGESVYGISAYGGMGVDIRDVVTIPEAGRREVTWFASPFLSRAGVRENLETGSSIGHVASTLAKWVSCDRGGGGCRADFNRAGGVNVQDIFDYLSAWFELSLNADMDNDQGVTVDDLFAYLTLWFAGC